MSRREGPVLYTVDGHRGAARHRAVGRAAGPPGGCAGQLATHERRGRRDDGRGPALSRPGRAAERRTGDSAREDAGPHRRTGRGDHQDLLCHRRARVRRAAIDVIGLGAAPSRGLRKGVVVNIDSTVEAIKEAVTQAEEMAGVEVARVYVGVAGGHIRGVNSRGCGGHLRQAPRGGRDRRAARGGRCPGHQSAPGPRDHPRAAPDLRGRRPGLRAGAHRHDAACASRSRCTSCRGRARRCRT